MKFSPSAATITNAAPVRTSAKVSTSAVSTPEPCRSSRTARPSASSPTHPTSAVDAPILAAATAWLAPLPPLLRKKSPLMTVSPGRGSSDTLQT